MTAMTLEAPSLFGLTPGRTTSEREKTISSSNPFKSLGAALQVASERATTQEAVSLIFVKPQLTDEQLISGICTGDEAAIEMLYERYHRYAYALAYRILRDPLAAEDIVQD